MTERAQISVSGRDGQLGWVYSDDLAAGNQDAPIHLENGLVARVPIELLVQQPDGTLYLPMSSDQFEATGQADETRGREGAINIPVVVEEVNVSKRQKTESRVRVNKSVQEREEQIEIPITREVVEIERVPVNRVVDSVPQVRQEENVTIIPILEEVLVVEKQLVLREEVRVIRKQIQEKETRRVTLRKENVDIERTEGDLSE